MSEETDDKSFKELIPMVKSLMDRDDTTITIEVKHPGTDILRVQWVYKHGVLDGESKEWYDNGQLEHVWTYKNGKLNGRSCSWYKSGKVLGVFNYHEGALEGLGQMWYENGKLLREETYNHGRFHGLRRKWYENGNLCIHRWS